METYNKDLAPKLVAYFKNRLSLYNYRNGWLKGDCPHCGKENKFGVNIGQNKSNCFVCNEKMKPLDLIVHLEGLSGRKDVYNFIKGLEDVDPFESSLKPLELKDVKLPESFTLINLGNDLVAKLARNYMRKRGFKIFDLALKGIGYCHEGKFGGCIILPIYFKGKLEYFIARKFIGNDNKFVNPGAEDFGLGKSQILYNKEALLYFDKVQIMESYLNALTYGETATSVQGKILSNYQKSIFITSRASRIEIVLDDDAYVHALELGMDLSGYKKVKVVKMPLGADVNEIGKKETRKIIKATPWSTYHDLYKIWLFEKSKREHESTRE